jgi:dinuclear metal center YbgI/SA1388 family protein
MSTRLDGIVAHCDALLRTAEVTDWPQARNGLQVANDGSVRRVVAAVDANILTLQAAVDAEAQLLVVHHGLFWSDLAPLTGPRLEKVRLCIANNLAVYSAHLPLDVHPRFGNNALLARALGLRRGLPFFEEKGVRIGLRFSVDLARDALVRRLGEAVGGPVTVIAGGPPRVRRVGIVTGGAGNDVARAAAEGVDTFITGEASHWVFGLAHELGVNLLLGGHYATETFGVKALASEIGRRFRVPWQFLDFPSGL